MTNPIDWITLRLSLVPAPDRFGNVLEAARMEWLEGGTQPRSEVLAPLRVLGSLSILLRYAAPEFQAELQARLESYSKEILGAVANSGGGFEKSILRELDYKLSVPEAILKDLARFSPSEIEEVYSLMEIEDEFLGFLEQAFLPLEGLRVLGFEQIVHGVEQRMDRLRTEFSPVCPKLAATYSDDLRGQRLQWIRSEPRDFWWSHMLADAALGVHP